MTEEREGFKWVTTEKYCLQLTLNNIHWIETKTKVKYDEKIDESMKNIYKFD